MSFIKLVIGMVLSILALVIAAKVLGFLFVLLGIVWFIVKMAFLIGVLALICWGVYRLVSPRRAQQAQ
ncbi:MAG: hypothetical protein AB1631_06950 [Acidobacteriota bacterium]